jgi:hypothetical protein
MALRSVPTQAVQSVAGTALAVAWRWASLVAVHAVRASAAPRMARVARVARVA